MGLSILLDIVFGYTGGFDSLGGLLLGSLAMLAGVIRILSSKAIHALYTKGVE